MLSRANLDLRPFISLRFAMVRVKRYDGELKGLLSLREGIAFAGRKNISRTILKGKLQEFCGNPDRVTACGPDRCKSNWECGKKPDEQAVEECWSCGFLGAAWREVMSA
jgi:hypothetical protein